MVATTKRSHVTVELESPAPATPASPAQPSNKKKARASSSPRKKLPRQPCPEPKGWRQAYGHIETMRKLKNAPVDTMGCAELGDKLASPLDFRFQTLVALMLSSQTKDEVTAGAVQRLRQELPGGLSIQSVLDASEEALAAILHPVGFYKRKAAYLRGTARALLERHAGDVPQTAQELCKLPGVGPKMSYLTLEAAWGLCDGIGVDLHVHRICNRLHWIDTKTPEQTRLALQDWLPKELWTPINKLMVGFGQQLCSAARPKCGDCLLRDTCPSMASLQSPVKKTPKKSKPKTPQKSEAKTPEKSQARPPKDSK